MEVVLVPDVPYHAAVNQMSAVAQGFGSVMSQTNQNKPVNQIFPEEDLAVRFQPPPAKKEPRFTVGTSFHKSSFLPSVFH